MLYVHHHFTENLIYPTLWETFIWFYKPPGYWANQNMLRINMVSVSKIHFLTTSVLLFFSFISLYTYKKPL